MSIQEKSEEFAILIAKYYLTLKKQKYYEIASQIFRSWTSIWANISEAQFWCSRKDFINKMNIALKEAKETLFWLNTSRKWLNQDCYELYTKCEEIMKILITIIKNTKENSKIP